MASPPFSLQQLFSFCLFAVSMICPTCKAEFRDPFFVRNATVTIENLDLRCANCNAVIPFESGTYAFDGDGLARLLSGPEFSPVVLQQLKHLVEQTKGAPETAENFVAAANAILPSLGDRLEAYLDTRKNTMAALGLLLTIIIWALAQYNSSSSPAPTTTNNTYNSLSVASPGAQPSGVRGIKIGPPAPRGSNLLPPQRKKRRKK